jgi:hypothetical protein
MTFTYRALSGPTNLDTATVSINVTPVNDAPTLSAQTNRTINEQTLLTVTNAGTDIDLPPQTLSYQLNVTNLANNAQVTGASINAQGVITWTPTEAQGGPSTNRLPLA